MVKLTPKEIDELAAQEAQRKIDRVTVQDVPAATPAKAAKKAK